MSIASYACGICGAAFGCDGAAMAAHMHAVHQIETMTPCVMMSREEYESLTAQLAAAHAARAAEQQTIRELLETTDRLARALDRCMVGGNHIASALIGALDGGFSEWFSDAEQAHAALWGKRADTDDMLYEVWTCWRVMMDARTMAGGPDWHDEILALLAQPAAEGGAGEKRPYVPRRPVDLSRYDDDEVHVEPSNVEPELLPAPETVFVEATSQQQPGDAAARSEGE